MIGQRKNRKQIMHWARKNTIPRFIIIEGAAGSGRKTLAELIYKQIVQDWTSSCTFAKDNSIDTVRQVIDLGIHSTAVQMYVFSNCDSMSLNAKNSLLKLVEEPPNKIYIIMTVKNLMNLPDTLKSRATILKIEHYSKEELKQAGLSPLQIESGITIGEAKQLNDGVLHGVKSLVDDVFGELFENKSGAGLLSKTTRLKDEVDPALFWYLFVNKIKQNPHVASNEIVSVINTVTKVIIRPTTDKKSCVECGLIAMLDIVKKG